MYLTQRVNSNGRTYPWNRQPIGSEIYRGQRVSNLFKSSQYLCCSGMLPQIPFGMHSGLEPYSKHRCLYLPHLSSPTVDRDTTSHHTVGKDHTNGSTIVARTIATESSAPRATNTTKQSCTNTRTKLVLFCLILFKTGFQKICST